MGPIEKTFTNYNMPTQYQNLLWLSGAVTNDHVFLLANANLVMTDFVFSGKSPFIIHS
jgi:hypothetical protein